MNTKTSRAFPPLPLLIALLQGLALLLLHQAIELDFWPDNEPHFLFMLYSAVLTGPTLFLLAYQPHFIRPFATRITLFALVCAALGFYTGYQAIPIEHIAYDRVLAPMVLTLTIASLLALVYLEASAEGEALDYGWLFKRAWRHALTLAFALLFVLLSWGVLLLWGALFDAIGIDFFIDLFTERWFYYPVLGLLNGLGIVLFRRQFKIIDTVVKLVHIIMWFLLIPLSFVSLLFLLTLPFTGLAPLWDSGGSFLILWMQILLIVFANMVAEEGDLDKLHYPKVFHWMMLTALLVLPIYSAISFYGLTLRISQYGWSVERGWAMLIWLVVLLFSLVYSASVIVKRLRWFSWARKANVVLGLVLLALLLVSNSPLLDFRKISTASQLARLTDSADPADVIDLYYFRYDLARPGYVALQDLKNRYADNAQFLADIDRMYLAYDAEISLEEFKSMVRQQNANISDALWEVIYTTTKDNYRWREINRTLYLIEAELFANGSREVILVDVGEYDAAYTGFYLGSETWQVTETFYLYPNDNRPPESNDDDEDTTFEALINAIEQGEWQVKESQWKDLEINGYRLSFD